MLYILIRIDSMNGLMAIIGSIVHAFLKCLDFDILLVIKKKVLSHCQIRDNHGMEKGYGISKPVLTLFLIFSNVVCSLLGLR